MTFIPFAAPRPGRPKKYISLDDHREIERRYLQAMDLTIQEIMQEKMEKRSREAALRRDVEAASQH